MSLEHSINVQSHERYPVHLKCLRNIKKIKYPDFQAMTVTCGSNIYSGNVGLKATDVQSTTHKYYALANEELILVKIYTYSLKEQYWVSFI